jgi:protein TonB
MTVVAHALVIWLLAVLLPSPTTVAAVRRAASVISVSLVSIDLAQDATPERVTPSRPVAPPNLTLRQTPQQSTEVPQTDANVLASPVSAANLPVTESAARAATPSERLTQTAAPTNLAQPKAQPPSFDADYLDNPAPSYPSLSRRAGEEGGVLLQVHVTADGRAEQVTVSRSSGFARLDAAAVEAVRRWRFVPARQGVRAVDGWVLVPINFSLKG